MNSIQQSSGMEFLPPPGSFFLAGEVQGCLLLFDANTLQRGVKGSPYQRSQGQKFRKWRSFPASEAEHSTVLKNSRTKAASPWLFLMLLFDQPHPIVPPHPDQKTDQGV